MTILDELRDVRDALDVEIGQRCMAEDFDGADRLRPISLRLGRTIAKLLRSPLADEIMREIDDRPQST